MKAGAVVTELSILHIPRYKMWEEKKLSVNYQHPHCAYQNSVVNLD